MSLFPPPDVVNTEVFARVPDKLRTRRLTEWSKINAGGQEIDTFLEGPSFDREGNLYLVDIPNGRIFRVSPQGDFSVVTEYDGEPNGLKIRGDGQIFIADYKNGILHLDPASGKVTPHVTRYRLEPFKGCNDLVFHSNGDIYFTDQGQTGYQDPTGRVFRYTTAGRLEQVLGGIPSPNGLVFNPAEKILYLAVTRANAVWRLPLMPDGGVSKVGLFVQLSGGLGGPDGLAVDREGGLLVCHAGMGAAWLFSRLGEPRFRIQSCTGLMTTNVAYGGKGNASVYITESETGTVLKADLPVAGQPMISHR
jgi:gluconolactonase